VDRPLKAGALLAFARMDGATRLSARTAVAKTKTKTQTVILTGQATLDLGRECREELGVEIAARAAAAAGG
jgi:uncharacterized protein GlcG (DUF336 family)